MLDKQKFIEALKEAESYNSVCRSMGLSKSHLKKIRDNDPEFNLEVDLILKEKREAARANAKTSEKAQSSSRKSREAKASARELSLAAPALAIEDLKGRIAAEIASIKGALVEAGKYSPLMDSAIKNAAINSVMLDLSIESLGGEALFIYETSREGDLRKKKNPSIDLIKDFAEASRMSLREIGTTNESKDRKGNKGRNALMDLMTKLADEDD